MKRIDSRYWIEISILTGALAGTALIVFGLLLPGLYPALLPLFLGAMVVLSIAGQLIFTRSMAGNFTRFNTAFLVFKSVKLLVVLAILVTCLLLDRGKVLSMTVSAFVIFFAFLFFESHSLGRLSRKQAEP